MFLGMGPFELIVILVVVLIIFGPKNLPKLGKSLGQTVKGIREGMDEAAPEVKEAEAKVAEAADVVVEKAEEAVSPIVEEGKQAVKAAEAAVAGDKKFCGECGAENPADNKFCAKCGHPLQ